MHVNQSYKASQKHLEKTTAHEWSVPIVPAVEKHLAGMTHRQKMRFARKVGERKCIEILSELLRQTDGTIKYKDVRVETTQHVAAGEASRIVSRVELTDSALHDEILKKNNTSVHVFVNVYLLA